MDVLQDKLTILHTLMQSKNLQDILDTGRTMYRHPLILCDLTHRVLAITDEPEITHKPWREIVAHGGIPLDKVSEAATLDCYRRSAETKKAQVQPSTHGEPPMLRRALCAGNKMIGYLDSPCYCDTDFTELDHSTFDLIADLCGLCMERDGGYGQVPDNMLEFFLSDLMEGRLTSEPLIEERLRYFHFPLHTPLTILSARLLDEKLTSVSILKDICLRLAAAFPLFTCFSYNDQIKCIIPPGAEGALSRSKVKKLEDTLRAEHLIAGVSRPLEALKDFAAFNRQSEKALELGHLLRPETPLHFYDNMAVFYALELCSDQIDSIHLVHSAIYTLAEYDRAHETNLLESLEAYLRCHMSIPDAANCLSIHRNTMSYRVNKINELIDVDLDNSETVFHLLFSYHVLEYYSATVMKDQQAQKQRRPQGL